MYYIVYSSITFATGIKNKFRYDREKITVMHTPSEISGGGCSYCIEVSTPEKALEIVKGSEEYGVTVMGIYEKKDNAYIKRSLSDDIS